MERVIVVELRSSYVFSPTHRGWDEGGVELEINSKEDCRKDQGFGILNVPHFTPVFTVRIIICLYLAHHLTTILA